jgi:hypothetical protein
MSGRPLLFLAQVVLRTKEHDHHGEHGDEQVFPHVWQQQMLPLQQPELEQPGLMLLLFLPSQQEVTERRLVFLL